jgi:hypothetical protein
VSRSLQEKAVFRGGSQLFDYLVSRTKFGGIKANESCRNRYNKELMQLLGNFDTLSFVRVSRLNWIGYVYGMDCKGKVS